MLDILAGRKIGKGIHGEVTFNGQQVTAANASKFASYVSQEDVFVPTLTVWEALQFYAILSIPEELTKQQLDSRMWAALVTMGLHKVKTSKVAHLPLLFVLVSLQHKLLPLLRVGLTKTQCSDLRHCFWFEDSIPES